MAETDAEPLGYAIGQMDQRPWGDWTVLDMGQGYIVKRIRVRPGGRLSLQRHAHREERWVVAEGSARVPLDSAVMTLAVGQSVAIGPRAVHRVENIADEWLVFIELQLGAVLDEDDSERRGAHFC